MKNIRLSFVGRLFAGILLSWVTLSIAGEPSKIEWQSTISHAIERGHLKVGVSFFKPWVMKNGEGQLVGFEIDVAKRLGKDMGLPVVFVDVPWEDIIPLLQKGGVDLIASGMTVTTERNLKVNFSIPYSRSGVSILAHRDRAKGFDRIEHFNSNEITLAVIKNSSSVILAEQQLPKARIQFYGSESQALEAVMEGRAHGMLAATPFPELSAAQYPDKLFVPFEQRLLKTSEAFAIRKGDVDSLNLLNNWILQRIEDGWLQDRHDYWFTSVEWKKETR